MAPHAGLELKYLIRFISKSEVLNFQKVTHVEYRKYFSLINYII